MKNTKAIVPNKMEMVSFSEEVKNYQSLLTEITIFEKKKIELSKEFEKTVSKYGISLKEGSNVRESIKSIKIEKKDTADKVTKALMEENYAFNSLMENREIMDILNKKFGDKLTKMIEAIGNTYWSDKGKYDTKKTKEVQEKLNKIFDDIEKNNLLLSEAINKKENIKEYVEFCKNIAEIGASTIKK